MKATTTTASRKSASPLLSRREPTLSRTPPRNARSLLTIPTTTTTSKSISSKPVVMDHHHAETAVGNSGNNSRTNKSSFGRSKSNPRTSSRPLPPSRTSLSPVRHSNRSFDFRSQQQQQQQQQRSFHSTMNRNDEEDEKDAIRYHKDHNDLMDHGERNEVREVLESRLSSMMKLRAQMEQLTDLQKKEESNYLEMMKELMKQSNVDRDKKSSLVASLKNRVGELETLLKEEIDAKEQVQKMFSTFRAEGSSIIHRLRDSLTRMSHKYREASEQLALTEQELNDQLKKNDELGQLYDEAMESIQKSENSSVADSELSDREHFYQGQIAYLKRSLNRAKREVVKLRGEKIGQTEGETEEDTHWDSVEVSRLKSKLKAEREKRLKVEKGVEEKFAEFQMLVEEEEEVIDALKQRVQEVESENQQLKQQLQSLISGKEHTCVTDVNEIPPEYVDIYMELKNLLDPEDSYHLQASADQKINPYDKIKAQDRLIKLLLTKLKAEEDERLKTEEQTAKMVAEEEKTIHFLETKVRDLEDIVTQQKEEAVKERTKLNRLVSTDKVKYFELVGNEEKTKALDEALQQMTKELNDEILISESMGDDDTEGRADESMNESFISVEPPILDSSNIEEDSNEKESVDNNQDKDKSSS